MDLGSSLGVVSSDDGLTQSIQSLRSVVINPCNHLIDLCLKKIGHISHILLGARSRGKTDAHENLNRQSCYIKVKVHICCLRECVLAHIFTPKVCGEMCGIHIDPVVRIMDKILLPIVEICVAFSTSLQNWINFLQDSFIFPHNCIMVIFRDV